MDAIILKKIRNDSKFKIKKKRSRLLAEANHACVFCGYSPHKHGTGHIYKSGTTWFYPQLTIDHIVPLVRGGTNDDENLQVLCEDCNSSKGTKNIVPPLNKRRMKKLTALGIKGTA